MLENLQSDADKKIEAMRLECKAKIKWDESRNQKLEELQKRDKDHQKLYDQ